METTTFGALAGTALILLAFLVGLTLLYHGWPKFGNRTKK